MLASRTERQVAGSLAPLTAVGYTFLHDRAWPGSRSAQIDHVLVGPGGLFIVDTKAWRAVKVVAGRIFRGDEDVTDELAPLEDVGYGTEAVMSQLGLAPTAVRVVIVLAGSSMPAAVVSSITVVGERKAAAHINSYGRRLTDTEADRVLGLARDHFPVLNAQSAPRDTTILAPVVAESEPEPLFTIGDVEDLISTAQNAEPIESWMTFLHPDHAKLVRRSFAGPARLRGGPGTGKTVIGLHRAAYLARSQPKRVLVTSFVKTLPDVLSQLMRRLAPEVSDRIEFAGVHGFAVRLLADRGIRSNVKQAEADRVFDSAWREVGAPVLAQLDRNPRYWRDEVSKVIKGRGLSSFDEYRELTRTGRRRGLTLDHRREVWKLYATYQNGLAARGIHDFDDIVLLAEASLRDTPLDTYGAVIIDEAQDLTCSMMKALHHLVGDAPDGLMVIGDGQQSIYPGGFTLGEAGISIAGRSVVLTQNYRNTREIVEFAARIVANDTFADIEGDIEARDTFTDVPRSGEEPILERFTSRSQHDHALLARLRSIDCSRADVGILCLTSHDSKQIRQMLDAVNIPTIDLADYTGAPVDAVKVGTVTRGKGLDFKSVLIPRVRPDWIDVVDHDDEAHVIRRRELYVGMTRARDELWVGVCA